MSLGVVLSGMLNLTVVLLIMSRSVFAAWTVRPAAPEHVSLLAGYAATLTAFGLRHPLEDDFQAYESGHRPLGRFEKIGDYAGRLIPNGFYAGTQLVLSSFDQDRAFVRMQLMVVATVEAALVSTFLKYVAAEQRPNGSDHQSFPSGHTTTAFAFAAIVAAEHGWAWGVPAVALAAFTGWSRINDNMHYLHDVLAGATIGTTFGLGVWLRQSRSQLKTVDLVPRVVPGGAELQARMAF